MVFFCFQDLPLDVIKKERKKILNARKPDKELQAYFSDPELGLIEVKGSLKTPRRAANHFTACQPYWLWGPYTCSYGAEILHRHDFYVS